MNIEFSIIENALSYEILIEFEENKELVVALRKKSGEFSVLGIFERTPEYDYFAEGAMNLDAGWKLYPAFKFKRSPTKVDDEFNKNEDMHVVLFRPECPLVVKTKDGTITTATMLMFKDEQSYWMEDVINYYVCSASSVKL